MVVLSRTSYTRAHSEPRRNSPSRDTLHNDPCRDMLHALLKTGRVTCTREANGSISLALAPPHSPPANTRNEPLVFRPRMDQWQEPANASTVMAFELPGVQASDLQLTIREGHLVVSGERKCPGNRQGKDAPPALGHELRYGKFKRAVFIRPDLQSTDISASLRDGLLYVTIAQSDSPHAAPAMYT